jgi:hypothetical protein
MSAECAVCKYTLDWYLFPAMPFPLTQIWPLLADSLLNPWGTFCRPSAYPILESPTFHKLSLQEALKMLASPSLTDLHSSILQHVQTTFLTCL